TYAVAVRKPEGEISVESFPIVSWTRRSRAFRWPIVRGVVALAQSLQLGFNALSVSANAQIEEEEQEIGGAAWGLTILAALALAVGLFFVVPVLLTSLIKDQLGSAFLFWLVEGLLRTAIFLGYLAVLSRQKDLRRVFEYHGAEHKVIAAYEAGQPLEPANPPRLSRLHPRRGTPFLPVGMGRPVLILAPFGLPPRCPPVAT